MYSYQELREQYTTFVYHGYDIEEFADNVKFTFHFEIEGLSSFAPAWTFPKKKEMNGIVTDEGLRAMAFSLGMVELISYWKIACPPSVLIEGEYLNENQIAWWKSLYFNGLGEFYYTNGIEENEQDFMTIIPGAADVTAARTRTDGEQQRQFASSVAGRSKLMDGAGCLIPIGGGKDSAVSLEVLKNYQKNNYCYIINPRGATLETVKAGGYSKEQVIAVHRTLDQNMLKLNREGFLNGHTPFSALVAFSSTIAAYMNGLKYIVLSNESSANESTVPGSTVNHQYSKSFAFEQDFHEYEAAYLKSGTYYFSLLRPLSEFQIASLFAQYHQYHGIFKSCNVGSKQDIWCGHCPKCLFVWLILSPFLTQQALVNIFGTNMLEDETMQETFEKLVGLVPDKPFECVGSRDEINAAIGMTIAAMEKAGTQLPYLLSYYKTTSLGNTGADTGEQYFCYYDSGNLLPEEFDAALKSAINQSRMN